MTMPSAEKRAVKREPGRPEEVLWGHLGVMRQLVDDRGMTPKDAARQIEANRTARMALRRRTPLEPRSLQTRLLRQWEKHKDEVRRPVSRSAEAQLWEAWHADNYRGITADDLEVILAARETIDAPLLEAIADLLRRRTKIP